MMNEPIISSMKEEEDQLKVDFHDILADYVREHRHASSSSRRADPEEAYLIEERFLTRAQDRLRFASKMLREMPGDRKKEGVMARHLEVEGDTWHVRLIIMHDDDDDDDCRTNIPTYILSSSISVVKTWTIPAWGPFVSYPLL